MHEGYIFWVELQEQTVLFQWSQKVGLSMGSPSLKLPFRPQGRNGPGRTYCVR
jgi:hypothetical protein